MRWPEQIQPIMDFDDRLTNFMREDTEEDYVWYSFDGRSRLRYPKRIPPVSVRDMCSRIIREDADPILDAESEASLLKFLKAREEER